MYDTLWSIDWTKDKELDMIITVSLPKKHVEKVEEMGKILANHYGISISRSAVIAMMIDQFSLPSCPIIRTKDNDSTRDSNND